MPASAVLLMSAMPSGTADESDAAQLVVGSGLNIAVSQALGTDGSPTENWMLG
jgi:hypothetical protein